MAGEATFILGGWQSDFAQKAPGGDIWPLVKESTLQGLDAARVEPSEIGVIHFGNVAGELFNGQAQLGAMVTAAHPDLFGTPATRHETACSSGSVAALAAMADLESGRYDVALVSGAEVLRNVPGQQAGEMLGCAVWVGRESVGEPYPWPHQFAVIADEYANRYGLEHQHLRRISDINLANAKRNPNAQTREWTLIPQGDGDQDELDPVVVGMLRKSDCGRITDGAAAIVLASRRFAEGWAERNGVDLADVPRISGWGHATGSLLLEDRLNAGRSSQYAMPHVRRAITDAYRRAGISGPEQLDAIETHDCFTITEYVAIDHFGITEPGDARKAVDDGTIDFDGALPINPSGGLLGLGHPVGATGVRMLLDCSKQVRGEAGDYQVDGARRMATLNIGGSFTTIVSFVVENGDPNP